MMDDCVRCQKQIIKDNIHVCPACGRGSAVWCKLHHCLQHFWLYMGMSPNEQGDCVEKANLCPIHLVRSHTLADCNAAHDAKSICGIDGCTRHHHKSLHGGTSPFLASVLMTASTDSSIIEPKNVLLSMQSISSLTGPLNCLFDNAAT